MLHCAIVLRDGGGGWYSYRFLYRMLTKPSLKKVSEKQMLKFIGACVGLFKFSYIRNY